MLCRMFAACFEICVVGFDVDIVVCVVACVAVSRPFPDRARSRTSPAAVRANERDRLPVSEALVLREARVENAPLDARTLFFDRESLPPQTALLPPRITTTTAPA